MVQVERSEGGSGDREYGEVVERPEGGYAHGEGLERPQIVAARDRALNSRRWGYCTAL